MNKASEIIEDLDKFIGIFIKNEQDDRIKDQLLDQLKQLTDWTAFEEKEPENSKSYLVKYKRKEKWWYQTMSYDFHNNQWVSLIGGLTVEPDNTFYKELE